MWIALISTLFLTLPGIFADVNITVDNTDPSILYHGIWNVITLTGYDYGGSQNLVDLGPNLTLPGADSTATFTFTGVAVYYMAPLWPFRVDTILTLDSDPPVAVNMTAPGQLVTSSPTGASAVSSVLWGRTGLTNTQHELVMSLATGGRYVIVDAFIYTAVPPPTSTSSGSSGMASTSTSTPKNDRRITALTALSSVLGSLLVLILAANTTFFLVSRLRPKPAQIVLAPAPATPTLSPFPTNIYTSRPPNEKGAGGLYANALASTVSSEPRSAPHTNTSPSTSQLPPRSRASSNGASVALTAVPPPYRAEG